MGPGFAGSGLVSALGQISNHVVSGPFKVRVAGEFCPLSGAWQIDFELGPKVAPGPGFRGMIRSAKIKASSTSLVIKTACFFFRPDVTFQSLPASRASTHPGRPRAHQRRYLGFIARVRDATETRCRIPPDNSDGRFPSAGVPDSPSRCTFRHAPGVGRQTDCPLVDREAVLVNRQPRQWQVMEFWNTIPRSGPAPTMGFSAHLGHPGIRCH